MKKNKVLLVIIIVSGIIVTGVGQNSCKIWYFGNHAGLDFRSGSPVAITNGAMEQLEACASICDANDSLLFYTDGDTVWNKNHTAMSNGTNLKGQYSSTMVCIVPKPAQPDHYYIFTADNNAGADGIYYYEVDMSQNGGLGDVIDSAGTQLFTPACEAVSAVQHSNETDYWVVTHEWGNNVFRVYPVTSTGVGTHTTYAIGNTLSGSSPGAIGYLKISPDNSQMVHMQRINWFSTGYIALFDFDNSNGQISNHTNIPFLGNAYGVEFSPDGNLLYASNWYYDSIYQYDLTAPDIPGSKQAFASFTTAGYVSGLQLGPDGKIYVSYPYHDSVGVINQPNQYGSACNYTGNAIYLEGKQSELGFPYFPQYLVTPDSIMPVKLTMFDAQNKKNQNMLTWKTATEINNDFFTLERSPDGVHFAAVTVISGAGNANTAKTYQYTDKNPLAGINYYRLKQTDFNGDYAFSNIITVENPAAPGTGETEISIFSHPEESSIAVHLNSPENDEVHIKLFDMQGKCISADRYAVHTGRNDFSISTPFSQSGVCFVQMTFSNGTVRQKKILNIN